MSEPYAGTIRRALPAAEIAFDPFHVIALAGAAVNQVRRAHAGSMGAYLDVGGSWIKHARWALLKGAEHLNADQQLALAQHPSHQPAALPRLPAQRTTPRPLPAPGPRPGARAPGRLAGLGVALPARAVHQARPHPAPLPQRDPHRHPPRAHQRPPRRPAQQDPAALPPQLRPALTPRPDRPDLPLLRRHHHHPTTAISHSNQRRTPVSCVVFVALYATQTPHLHTHTLPPAPTCVYVVA